MANLACHPHDKQFTASILSPLPWNIKTAVSRRYSALFSNQSRREANLFLLSVRDRVGPKSIRLASNDDDLCIFARNRAGECGRVDPEQLPAFVEQLGFDFPEGKTITPEGAEARCKDEHWWRRQVRRKHGRDVESVARDLELVHLRAGKYVSDESLHRRRQQKSRNRATLEAMLAVNELGDSFTLQELSDLSVSNPVIRRSELMVRMAGFERLADDLGHVAEFYTLTCPSRFHSHTYGKNNKVTKVIRNKNYEPGLTPRDAAEYLQKVWAKVRAKFGRAGYRPYGFRVAEPHHDGCPHWHLLLFMPESIREEVREIFTDYALMDSPGERGAKENRFKAVPIDKARGTATGYIAKYIAKNIDAYGLEGDLYGDDPKSGAERVDAWASTWGIRQFQQVGGPSVTVWRELRRLEPEQVDTMAGFVLESARAAADAGDWAEYVRVMDGLKGRKWHPIRTAKIQDVDQTTGELMPNKYGEESPGRILGVECGNVVYVTRWHEWKIEKSGLDEREKLSSVSVVNGFSLLPLGFEVSGAVAPPWSSVNNCTGVGSGKDRKLQATTRFDKGMWGGGRKSNPGNGEIVENIQSSG